MMAETTLYNYIAAALTFVLLSVQGTNASCKNINFIEIGGKCYRPNREMLKWTKAKDNCERWNGKLATFTSLDHMTEVAKTFYMYYDHFWIGAQDNQDIGSLWKGDIFGDDSYVMVLPKAPEDCNLEWLPSICTEINNDMLVNDVGLTTTTTQTVTCLHKDSIPVDGQCYWSSTEKFQWSEAHNYCNSLNGTLATLDLSDKWIEILLINKFYGDMWVQNPFKKDTGHSVDQLTEKEMRCNPFVYGERSLTTWTLRVLCKELRKLRLGLQFRANQLKI